MIKINRKRQNKEFIVFDDSPETAGFMEQWYLGNYELGKGIRVEKEEQVSYARIISINKGILLGNKHFCGFITQDKIYEELSYLVNGSTVTYSLMKEKYSEDEITTEKMPLQMLSILSETKERILETARILKLPLEEAVKTT